MLFLPVLKGGFPRFFSLQEQMRVTVLNKKCGSVVLFLPVLKLGFPCFLLVSALRKTCGSARWTQFVKTTDTLWPPRLAAWAVGPEITVYTASFSSRAVWPALNSPRPSTHHGPLVPQRRAAVVRSTLNIYYCQAPRRVFNPIFMALNCSKQDPFLYNVARQNVWVCPFSAFSFAKSELYYGGCPS